MFVYDLQCILETVNISVFVQAWEHILYAFSGTILGDEDFLSFHDAKLLKITTATTGTLFHLIQG